MDILNEIDGIIIQGRAEADVRADLAKYIRRAVVPLSLFELSSSEILPRDLDVLEHVLKRAEEAKAVFDKDVLDAASLIKLGNLAYCKNELSVAQDLYRRSIKVQETPVALKNLGVALLSEGKPVDAREALENAVARDRKDPQTLFYLGLTWEAVAEGKVKSPIGVIATTTLDKEQVKEHLEKALEYYNDTLELDPKFGPALYNKSVVLTLLGRKEEANDVIIQMLKGQPASEAGWIARGLIMRQSGNHEGALKCYENAIVINPNSHLGWLNKSVALFVLKKYEEAIVAVDKAIELNSSSEIAWSNKGAILAELKRFKDAIPCFDKAVDLNPAFDGAKKNRAHAIEALAKKGKDSPKKSSRKPRASSPKRGKGKRRR